MWRSRNLTLSHIERLLSRTIASSVSWRFSPGFIGRTLGSSGVSGGGQRGSLFSSACRAAPASCRRRSSAMRCASASAFSRRDFSCARRRTPASSLRRSPVGLRSPAFPTLFRGYPRLTERLDDLAAETLDRLANGGTYEHLDDERTASRRIGACRRSREPDRFAIALRFPMPELACRGAEKLGRLGQVPVHE